MVSTKRVVLLAFVVALPVGTAGCLGDDIWREPFVWREAADFGENQDAAQAFAAGFQSLAEQAQDQGDAVVETARDLPDNVIFQNARDFLNQRVPGLGDEVDATVHLAADTVADTYLTLTGQAASVYNQVTGPLLGTETPLSFQVPERTTKLRWTLDVVLTGQEAPEAGQNPTPIGVVYVTIIDPDGRVRADYKVDTTRQTLDQVVEGTFGDRSEVRSHLGGVWRVEVDANAEGAWSLIVESYEPKYDDYEWWQFWRAERRKVTGE